MTRSGRMAANRRSGSDGSMPLIWVSLRGR
jgi:hypothetical protein